MKRVWWFVVWSGLTYLFCLAMMIAASGCPLKAAPAPLPKRPRPATEMPHACTMLWGTSKYATHFHPNGSYDAHSPSCHWVGWWSFDRGTRILTIKERTSTAGDDWPYDHYHIELESDLRRGTLPSGGAFALQEE